MIQMHCGRKAQTFAKASNPHQKLSGIRIWTSDEAGFGSTCPPDHFQNVVDSLSSRRQSFRRVSWKSAGDCMRLRYANKLNPLKFPTPQWWLKWKNDQESVSRTGSPPKVNKLFSIGRRYKFQSNYFCSNPANRTTDWQTIIALIA